jgi:hypothetical protein
VYSACAKIFRAFFVSVLLFLCALLIFACFVLCLIAAFEYLHGFNLLPHFIERVYVNLGGV